MSKKRYVLLSPMGLEGKEMTSARARRIFQFVIAAQDGICYSTYNHEQFEAAVKIKKHLREIVYLMSELYKKATDENEE